MAGRPTLRTPEVEEDILVGLMSGMSLVKICQLEGMPERTTVCKWMANDEDFSTKCARAREFQGELSDDKLIDIVEQVEAGTLAPDQARVMASILQWRASKLKPKVYGDKQAVDLTSNGKTIDSLTDDERTARLAALLDGARERRAGQAAQE
jgi:hypothetical protein